MHHRHIVSTLNILVFAMTPYNLTEIKRLCERFYSTGYSTNIIVLCDIWSCYNPAFSLTLKPVFLSHNFL